MCYFVKRSVGPHSYEPVRPYLHTESQPLRNSNACYSIRAAQCVRHRCTSRPVLFNRTPRLRAYVQHAEWCKHAFKRVPLTNKQIRLAERFALRVECFPPSFTAREFIDENISYMHMNKILFTTQMLYVLYYNCVLNSYRENNDIVIKTPDCPTVFLRAESVQKKKKKRFYKKPPPE